MVRDVCCGALIALAMLVALSTTGLAPSAHATPALSDVLLRLQALEKENASLRKRVQRLEAEPRHRPTIASAPVSTRHETSATRTPSLTTGAIPAAAGLAYASASGFDQPRDWTGVYAGLSGGLRRENHTWTTNAFFGPPLGPISSWPNGMDFSETGARFGGFVGYNFQFGSKFVFGIEGDFAWGSTSAKTSHAIPGASLGIFPMGGFAPNDSSEFKTEWDATLRARIGVLITPETLAYLTGGAAWQRIEATATCDATAAFAVICAVDSRTDSQTRTLTGWTLGAGLEAILAGAWTGRIEYRYAQYSDFNHLFIPTNCCDGNLDTTISLSTHTFVAGVAYKLGGY